jgi:hypothetical protein
MLCRRCDDPVKFPPYCPECSLVVTSIIKRWALSNPWRSTDLTGPELAAELGLSVNAFEKRVERIRRALEGRPESRYHRRDARPKTPEEVERRRQQLRAAQARWKAKLQSGDHHAG